MIVYDTVGASDAHRAGSSVGCPPFVDCPNWGYPQVAIRQLKALGFEVPLINLGNRRFLSIVPNPQPANGFR